MNKQIEKLSEELLFYTLIHNDDLCDEVAEYIITAGYRKKEDVAREIFEEIEELMTSLDKRHMQGGNPKQAWGIRNAMWEIAKLKKKYGVTDDGDF